MSDGSSQPGPPPGYGQPGQPQQQPHQQPQQPQPGYPPQGYGAPQPGYQQAPAPFGPSGGSATSISTWLGLVSVVVMVLAVSINEDDDNGWGRIGVWAGFAIASAALTLVPLMADQFKLTATRAWQVAAAGAVGLGAFWVLFVLPSISMNVSFAATVGVVAGVAAAWTAPGKPDTSAANGGQPGNW